MPDRPPPASRRRPIVRPDGGYAVLWLLVMAAWIAVAILLGITLRPRAHEDRGAYLLILAAVGLVLAGGLLVEFRRDRYEFCMFVGMFSFITALLCGAWVFAIEGPGPLSVALGIVTTLAALSCGAYLLVIRRSRGPHPDLLRALVGRKHVSELAGVQLAFTLPEAKVEAGEQTELNLYLQNCWNHPRTVSVELSQDTRVTLSRAVLHFPMQFSVDLDGAMVGRVRVPVLAHPESKDRFILRPEVKVSGKGGERVRQWRARGYSNPVSPLVTMLGCLAGMLVTRGGMTFDIRVMRRSGGPGIDDLEEPSEPGEPIWEVLYEASAEPPQPGPEAAAFPDEESPHPLLE